MIILLRLSSLVFFLLLLSECNAGEYFGCVGSDCFGSKKKFDVDDFDYVGDPVTFACVHALTQWKFFIAEMNDTMPTHLINRLDDTLGISLLFHGFGNKITLNNGLLYQFAKEWFIKSNKNICIVSYAFEKATGVLGDLKKMVTTKRLEFVAKLATDLVLGVRAKSPQLNGEPSLTMSKVDVTGFSFGAHIAGRTCQYLQNKTNEKVRMFLALDPSRTPPILATKPTNTIKKGLAEHLQVIHTSSVCGLMDQLGDTDVYVQFKPNKSFRESISECHGLAFFIHVATATKRLYAIATKKEKEKGKLIKTDPLVGSSFVEPILEENELLIGIYGSSHGTQPNQKKKFVISFKERIEILWDALGELSDPHIFFESTGPQCYAGEGSKYVL